MSGASEDPAIERMRARRAEAEAAEIDVATEIAAQRAMLDGLVDQIDALLQSIGENNVKALEWQGKVTSRGGVCSATITDVTMLRRQIIGRLHHKAVRI